MNKQEQELKRKKLALSEKLKEEFNRIYKKLGYVSEDIRFHPSARIWLGGGYVCNFEKEQPIVEAVIHDFETTCKDYDVE